MKKKIPKFTSEKEERRFWQKHDSSEYLDWSDAEEVVLPKPPSGLGRAGGGHRAGAPPARRSG